MTVREAAQRSAGNELSLALVLTAFEALTAILEACNQEPTSWLRGDDLLLGSASPRYKLRERLARRSLAEHGVTGAAADRALELARSGSVNWKDRT